MKDKVGVVIGRFQVDQLHQGHVFLINHAMTQHHKVIVFIGCSPRAGKSDPLDYPTRERMVRAEFPGVWIMPLKDQSNDKSWSSLIDDQIDTLFPGMDAVLYGGRDSFIPHYLGKHATVEVESKISYMSGTQLREDIGKVVRTSAEFRAGIIYGSQNAVPRPVMCADIAVLKRSEECKPCTGKFDLNEVFILMGKKDWDTKWRLPGGKLEITDASLERAARRELQEETSVSIEGEMTYLGSDVIRDWRDGGKADVVYMAALFTGWYTFGAPKAADDLKTLQWIRVTDAMESVNPEGRVQIEKVIKFLNK